MQEVGYAALQIIPSFKNLDKNLEAGTSKAMLAAGVRGGGHFGDAAGRSAGQRFSRVFMSAAKVGLVGLAAAGAAAFKIGKDAVGEAREAQKVTALTASTIKATGGAAKVTAGQVGDLAEAISLKAGIDDEAIQSGLNMLLTFKNIRNEAGEGNKIFDQSSQALIDMSSAMGTDAKSAAIQMGKALNDPIKGISALSRVGIQFTEDQKKSIEAMVESGNVMGAQKVILRELESQFGGAAAAQATMGEKVSVAWGNVQEKLGTALLPLIDDVQRAFLKKGIPAVEKFVGWFEDKGIPKLRKFGGFIMDEVVPAVSDFAGEMKPLAQSLLPAAGDALEIMADAAKKAAPFVKDLVDAFRDMPDWAKTALVGGGAAAFAGGKLARGGLGGGLAAVAGSAKPVPVFVTNPGFGGGAGGGKGGSGKSGLMGWGPIGAAATVGAIANDQFPSAMPFGEKGWAADLDKYVLTMDGIKKKTGEAAAETSKVVEGAEEMAAAFKKLPSDVQTDMVLNGVPESRKQAMELVRQYNLTPREKRTLFEAAGIPDAKRTIGDLKRVIVEHPDKKDTKFNLLGTDAAKSDLASVKGWMDSIRDKTVYLNVQTRRGNESGGMGAVGSADGGTVPKTGMGYADRHLYMLADGEEVISNRYGQADRYRHLLKAINANRAADGATVGGGRSGAVVTERVVERLPRTIVLDAGALGRIVVDATRAEMNADREFERQMNRG